MTTKTTTWLKTLRLLAWLTAAVLTVVFSLLGDIGMGATLSSAASSLDEE